MPHRWFASAISLLLAWPLFAALSAGREIPLATPVIEPSPFLRDTVRAASNGRDFLVVWNDVFPTQQREVRAARVTAEGEVLDASLVVAQNSGSVLGVASNGRDYVVAYDCTLASRSRRTCLAHVDAKTGAVTQTAGIENAGFGSIASNGNGYLLAYHYDTRSTVHAVAVRDDGTLTGEPFLLGFGRFAPWLASNGEHYYAVWSTYQHLVGVLLSDRAPLGAVQTLTGQPPAWGPAAFGWTVASDGDDFLVAWQQNLRVVVPVYETELRTRVISANGTVGESRTVVAGEEAFHPAAIWTGSEYFLTYTRSLQQSAPYLWPDSDGDVRGLSIDSSGGAAAAPVTFAGRPGREAASVAASNGMSTLIAWQRVHSTGTAQVEGVLTGGSTQVTPVVISRSVTWQDSTTAARIGASTIAAWDERVGERQHRKVFLQRLDDSGHPLLGRGLAVAETALDQFHPALGGSAVAWVQQERDPYAGLASVHLRFFEGDGQLALDPPLSLGDAQRGTRVAVAAAGATHLVVWTAPDGQVVGMRVSPAGYVDRQPFVISRDEPHRAFDPVVVSDGRDFFVAWNVEAHGSGCGVCFPYTSLSGVAVSAAGTVIGAPFELAPAQAARPSLLWNGERYVAVWFQAGSNDRLIRSAYVLEIDRSGNPVTAPRAIRLDAEPLAAVWTGSDYLVATAAGDVRAGRKLQVARLSRDFTSLELVPLVSRWRGSQNVSLVPLPGDRALLTYEAFLPGGGISSRAVARPIGGDVGILRRRAVR